MVEHPATRAPDLTEDVATIALMFGRLLMEAGATARTVEQTMEGVARGLGADRCDLRVGYASLAITLHSSEHAITRVCRVGPMGVNQELYYSLDSLAAQIVNSSYTPDGARCVLDALVRDSKRHPDWMMSVAVGAACAAFGRLLGVNWLSLGPIFVAATVAQLIRGQLARRHVNSFLTTATVAFLGSLVCGLATRFIGTENVARDMIVAVLLLVPGVPAFNAQFDILEGRPTLGSARAVWVMVTLVFMALGIWVAAGLLGEGR